MKAAALRGQAAVEYLTTYGWAILALIIVLGVLLYSGVLTPNQFVTEECYFGSNVPCQAAIFDQAGSTQVSMRLFNGFAYTVQITAMSLATSDGQAVVWTGSFPVNLSSGQNLDISGTLAGPQVPQDIAKHFTGNITYASCAPEINVSSCSTSTHVLSGKVIAKIIPK